MPMSKLISCQCKQCGVQWVGTEGEYSDRDFCNPDCEEKFIAKHSKQSKEISKVQNLKSSTN